MKRIRRIWYIAFFEVVLIGWVAGIDAGPDAYSLEIVESEPGTNRVVLELRNKSLSIATYKGYGVLWYGFSPVHWTQDFDGTEWANVPSGWCGTGLATRVLLPGASVRFTANLHNVNRGIALTVNSGFMSSWPIGLHSPKIDTVAI